MQKCPERQLQMYCHTEHYHRNTHRHQLGPSLLPIFFFFNPSHSEKSNQKLMEIQIAPATESNEFSYESALALPPE